MDAKEIIINDSINDTIQIFGVVYHREVFRVLAREDLEGKSVRFVSTPEKFHGRAFSLEVIDEDPIE